MGITIYNSCNIDWIDEKKSYHINVLFEEVPDDLVVSGAVGFSVLLSVIRDMEHIPKHQSSVIPSIINM